MYKLAPLPPITKSATNTKNYARPIFQYANARTAFKAFLLSMHLEPGDEVWLPAYIGWSNHEGSGVFDPIQEVGASFKFYKMTDSLDIDFEYLRAMAENTQPRLLVLIHYFGFPDKNINKIIQWASECHITILEDEAHALYSDWIGHVCGRYGNAAIMSLHKMLPFQSGGLLLLNNTISNDRKTILSKYSSTLSPTQNILDYDLSSIAKVRRKNSQKLLQLLKPLQDRVVPLYSHLPKGVVPQTIPVRIYGHSRDDLYFELNNLGYGVVSLYHTLINQISATQFPASHALAKNILNLPVHQDVTIEQLKALTNHLGKLTT